MSTYQEINARAWNECRLISATLELTHLCNYDCFYCSNDRVPRDAPLTLEEYSDLLPQLANMAVLNLTLTGGEPLVHPDFFAIAGRARELGFVIRIKSNGHLIHGEVARRLVDEVAPYQIDLSVHGANAATHDRQTRREGSFDKLMVNIEGMKKLGLRAKLNCTLTAWNEHEIEGIFKLADELQLPLTFNPSVSPRDDGNRDPLRVTPSAEAIMTLARILERRRSGIELTDREESQGVGAEQRAPKVTRHCGAGSSSVTIDQWGNVLPCVQWRRVIGNIRKASIAEIWASSNELREVQAITVKAKEVAARLDGPEGVTLFCPGLAELQNGDPLALHPLKPSE